MRPRLAILLLLGFAARGEVLQLTPATSAYADQKGEALRSPQGVACTADGYVVAADSGNGRLITWRYKDGALTGGAEIRFPELGYPVRVQIDSHGNVLSLDQRSRRLVRVGPDGKYGGMVAFKGVPPEAGFFPVAFKLDRADNVYVLDAMSGRVIVTSPAGAFLRQIEAPRDTELMDIAVDAKGILYAVDGPHATVWQAAPDARAFSVLGGPLKDYMSFPTYLAVTDGPLVLVDGHGNGLVLVARDGTFLGRRLSIGWTEGLVYYPGQICIDGKGDVFVADRGNQRVQVFAPAK